MKVYKVEVTRDGKWWMVSIPELDGLTQARRLGETEQMAREFIAVETGTPIADVVVDLGVAVGAVTDASARAEQIRKDREEAARLESLALTESRILAQCLAKENVPVRDIGELLGVTFQRASQLVNS
ncbi:hypothetical protein [Rhodococcus sp. LB1]|uniref:hypothetical protein n=1 Tax=Rhodococcus sp. LB1 TaxID=1807499 RepID=UPI00077B0FF4|nr:hypothetical protein [Rhodococcus sp. LB1]KXX56830.1 HicB family toxin-antitoxin system [Rhodococcus sp. LB1]